MSASPPPRTPKPSLGCGYAVCVVLAVAAVALLLGAQQRWSRGRTTDAWLLGIWGGLSGAAAIGLIALMQRAVAQARERERRETAKPAAPWTWDPSWTAPGGIPQTGRRHAGALLVFAILALAISLPLFTALPREVRRGNHVVWLGLVFPLLGTGLLARVGFDAWRRRKYGEARFVPAEIPVPLGGELSGFVRVGRFVQPSGPGEAALVCWATRLTHNGGGKRRREEMIVARADRVVARDAWERDAGESRLWVQLPVRGEQPSTMAPLSENEPTFEWRLRVEVPTAGADFAAEFVVPVFPSAALPSAPRVVQAEVWKAARVREESEPAAVGGTALVLPGGQARGFVLGLGAVALGLAGAAVALRSAGVPGFFAIMTGLAALIPLAIARTLWTGGGERIWVERDHIGVRTRSGVSRRIARAEVVRLETAHRVGAGARQYYAVVARGAPAGRWQARTEIASLVQGDEAAAEVVSWLEERLTRPRP